MPPLKPLVNKWLTKKALLVALLVQFFPPDTRAQCITNYFVPTLTKKLPLKYSPFSEVQILDNRFDTTQLFTIEDGEYPIRRLNIDQPAAYTIKKYITEAILPLSKGNKTLLINITQLRITNKGSIERTPNNHGRNPGKGMRNYVIFSAEAYYKTGKKQYSKIVTVHKNYKVYSQPQRTISAIFNELMEAASNIGDTLLNTITDKPKQLRFLHADTTSFKYSQDTANIALDQINTNQRTKWADYSIVANTDTSRGIFNNFDDFRANSALQRTVHLLWDAKDSAYTVDPFSYANLCNNRLPWAIRDSGNLYIALNRRFYVQLKRFNNSFYFYVPQSLPNMYALTSLENGAANSGNVAVPTTGNLIAALITTIAATAINIGVEAAKTKRILQNGLQSGFRDCYIDMDTGDIVY